MRGDVHTNTVESVWSLFKRSVIDSYYQASVLGRSAAATPAVASDTERSTILPSDPPLATSMPFCEKATDQIQSLCQRIGRCRPESTPEDADEQVALLDPENGVDETLRAGSVEAARGANPAGRAGRHGRSTSSRERSPVRQRVAPGRTGVDI